MRKPTGLAAAMTKKAAVTAQAAVAPPAASTTDDGHAKVILTLRLPPPVHAQLRELSFTSRRSQHALAMRGLNLMFEQNGLPPIAPDNPG